MRGKGLTSTLVAKHLAELKERQERKKARAKKRAAKRQAMYNRKCNRKWRTRQRREIAELLRIIKASMKEW